jgi:hypothetical protein
MSPATSMVWYTVVPLSGSYINHFLELGVSPVIEPHIEPAACHSRDSAPRTLSELHHNICLFSFSILNHHTRRRSTTTQVPFGGAGEFR